MKDKRKNKEEEEKDLDQTEDTIKIIGSIDPIIPEKKPPNDRIKDHFITEEDKANST